MKQVSKVRPVSVDVPQMAPIGIAAGRRGRRDLILAAIIMMALALIYLWPALVAGKVLSPNSVLFLFAPWHSAAPTGFEHTWNPVLSDIPTAYYPWNFFAREMIRSGMFPAWNPDAYSGTPFYANAQTGILNPFNLPLWLLPLNYGIALSAWLKLWLGGLGAYLLARELRLGFWPAILAGVSFLLCAFNVVWLTFETLPGVAVMMPWALWLGERLARRRRPADAIALAVVSAVAIAAGHPETAVQMFAGTVLYILARVLTLRDSSGAERIRGLALGIGGIVGGTLLSAVILIPVLRVGLGTPGAAFRAGGTFSLPWSAAKTALFPNWWEGRTLPLPGPANYNVRTFYVGTTALLLSFVALIARGRYREKVALVLIAAVGVAVSFGVPVIHWVVTHLPPLNETTTPYMLLWFEVAVPVLAAFGLQSLLDSPHHQRIAWSAVAGAALVALIAVAAVSPSLHEIRTALNQLRTGRSYSDPKIISLTSIGWMSVFAALLGGALVFLRRTSHRSWAAVAIVLLASVDLLHFAHGYQPMLSPTQATPPKTAAVTYLQGHAGRQRVIGIGNTLANDYDMVYGLHDARGYDPPQPSYRYLHLWQIANPGQIAVAPFQVPTLSPIGLKVMSLLGVRYVIDDSAAAPITALQRSVVYRGRDATIYQNSLSAPPVLVARTVVKVPGERDALRMISSSTFDPRTEAIVESGQSGVASIPVSSQGGAASVIHADNSKLTLRAHLPQPGLVVLDDAMAAGWTVTVDGRQRPGLLVDDVMRGVSVPGGSHVIVWRYAVPGLRLGAIVSIFTALVLAVSGALLFRVRSAGARRQPTDAPKDPGTPA
jgi:hypothetical protein